jgi:hypothetical protein
MERSDRIVFTDLYGRGLKICRQSMAQSMDIGGLPSGHFMVTIPVPCSLVAKKLIVAHQ